jgi:integration host factor subunit alpha
VKLSLFCSFVVRRKTQRIGRNPKTGIEAPPSAILKQRINSGSDGDIECRVAAAIRPTREKERVEHLTD